MSGVKHRDAEPIYCRVLAAVMIVDDCLFTTSTSPFLASVDDCPDID